MNKDELTLLKEYVNTLESENDSKNRERAMLQRQVDTLLNENNQLRSLRPSNDSQLISEKNRQIGTLIKQIQDQNREIESLKSQKNPIQDNFSFQFTGDISILKQELDGLQLEIAKARKEFSLKESDWDNERRNYLNEINQLKANLTSNQKQGDIRGEFEKLRVGYSKLEMELNNRISQLQASSRIMESEKNKLTLERDNLKQERDRLAVRVTDLERQQNNRIGSTLIPQNAHRIAELNSVIADLNSQLQAITRERDIEREKQETIRLGGRDQDRVSELTSLVEELNNDRNRMKADFDIVRSDRDRLQSVVSAIEREKIQLTAQLANIVNQRSQGSQSGLRIDQAGLLDSLKQEKDRLTARVFQLEREKTARVPLSPVKDNEWMKEKSQLLLEINNLKNEKNSVGWVVDGHNRRIDDLQRENALIKGQLQLSEQQLADYRRKEDVVRQDIQHLNSQIDRLVKSSDSKRFIDAELSKSKTQIANLINANSILQNELNILKQSGPHEHTSSIEFNRLVQINKQLERRVYVLETANYNLSEQINKNLQQSKSNPSIDHLIQALKSELMELKIQNQKLVQINQEIMVDYKECSEKLKLQMMQRENRARSLSNTRSRMTRQPELPSQNIQNLYTKAQYTQRLLSEPNQGVFQQRWESNDNQTYQHKIYKPHPAQGVDVSKWSNLQKKINALKVENEQLKRSLNFTSI